MARYDDLNTGTLGYLTFMSVILLAIIIFLLQALTYNWIDWQEEGKLVKQSYQSSDEVLEAQKASLTNYNFVEVELPPAPGPDGTVDPKAQPVKDPRWYIPIEKAESMLLEKMKSQSKAATPST